MGLDFGPVRAKVHGALMDAAKAAGDVVLERSNELVPIEGRPDTHGVTLAESGKVSEVADLSDSAIAAVSYEGPYAIYQHEGLEFKHPTGGHAKYLEIAMNEKLEEATDAAGNVLRGVLEG